MKDQNIQSLKQLSRVCVLCGPLPVFFGLFVMFVGVISDDMPLLSTGLFMFLIGYAYVKIGKLVLRVIQDEEQP